MFKHLFEFMSEIFRPASLSESLEQFIAAGNPQDAGDVERLEAEYHRRRQSFFFDRYY